MGRARGRRAAGGDPAGNRDGVLRIAEATPFERAPESLAAGRDLWLKREDVHQLGAFKWRGALPVVEQLAVRERAVVTASTGNHAAAVAWACRLHGMEAIVFVPAAAVAAKLARLEDLGATIRFVDGDLDDAKEVARDFAGVERLPFFEDGAEPLQYEGYAAIGRELLDQCPRLAAVVIPVGNGALAGGIGAVVRRRRARRIGVVAEQMPVMADSFEQGRPLELDGGETIADGLAVRVAIPLAVERLAAALDEFVRISEAAIVEAMRRCSEVGLAVEASAAAGIAALDELRALNGPIVCVITGRNADRSTLGP